MKKKLQKKKKPAEEPKEEPKAEEKAPETPAEPVAPAEAVKEVAATPAAAPAEAKKGNKKGVLIGCAVGAVVLVGGGLGTAYAITHSPENVALSAISNFFSTKDLAVNGTFELTPSETSTNSGIERVAVTIKSDADKEHQGDTTATFAVTYEGKEYSISVGSVLIKDYTLYVSINNLKETVNKIMEEAIKGSDYESYADLYEDLINTVVGEIDGVWWKISVPDLIDAVDELTESQKSQAKEFYGCMTDVMDKAAADTSTADIYKENAFISLKKYEGGKSFSGKGTAYNVTFDAAKLTTFANKSAEKAESYGIEDCVKKANPSANYSRSEIKQEDVEKALESLPENIYVTIDSGLFSSELTGFYVDMAEKDYSGKVDITFAHSSKSISAPADSKSINELYTNVEKAYSDWQATSKCRMMKKSYPTYYNYYCDPSTDKIRPEYESQFNS